MTNDIHLAFAHPSERAAATANGPADRISVRDYIVEVEIGAFQQERGTTQRVQFNIVVEVQPIEGPIDDDVDRILSYDRVTEAITIELSEERLNLLETLAERVADRILLEPQATRCFVRIEKLDRGSGALGVEIVRSRPLKVVDPSDTLALPPLVVMLSNAAIGASHLKGWLDQLASKDAPVILCVGLPEGTPPASQVGPAQRRIDLLAIEQNAWVLAGCDPRCVVVATRTELDWAMKNGQICVWAPSKIVLDAVEGPATQPRDAVALNAWFATELEAAAYWVIGPDTPHAARSIDADQAQL